PEVGEAFDGILADLEKLILPGITHWQSPNFFAYFPANASGPAILGDLLSSAEGGGVIQDTASSAVLCALLAARERATNFACNREGCAAKFAVYTSAQAHSSIEKAVKISGVGSENLRLIEVDENFAMRPDALLQQIEADRQAGLTPCFVCATVGTTSSNAMDPIREIACICRENKIWLHVDAAMSGTAALCPEFRWIQDGVEFADSYCFNPHK